MLVHPECSCTRASFSELNGIMNRAVGGLSVWVLVVDPRSKVSTPSTDAFTKNPMAGVTFLPDAEGREADLFGARTSGQVVLYDPSGHLLYSGGVTGARGHAGDNMGRRQILQAVANGSSQSSRPVFGCALTNGKSVIQDAAAGTHRPSTAGVGSSL
jgi:hypothetical protein